MKYVYINLPLGSENSDISDICTALNRDPKTFQELLTELNRDKRDLELELKILRKSRLIDLVPTITPEEADRYATTAKS